MPYSLLYKLSVLLVGLAEIFAKKRMSLEVVNSPVPCSFDLFLQIGLSLLIDFGFRTLRQTNFTLALVSR